MFSFVANFHWIARVATARTFSCCWPLSLSVFLSGGYLPILSDFKGSFLVFFPDYVYSINFGKQNIKNEKKKIKKIKNVVFVLTLYCDQTKLKFKRKISRIYKKKKFFFVHISYQLLTIYS